MSRLSERSPYVEERADRTFKYSEKGALIQIDVVLEIRALQDGMDRITLAYDYDAKEVGHIDLEPLIGCEPWRVGWAKDDPRLLLAGVTIPKLNRGRSHFLAYRLRIESAVRTRPFVGYTVTLPVQELVLRLHFHPNHFPPMAWFFDAVPSALQLPWRATPSTTLVPEGERFIKRFENLRRGTVYGVAWRWPTRRSAS